MKKILLACLMTLFSISTWAGNGIEVDGIYYNFSDDTLEATVTCSGNEGVGASATNDYTGDIVIPETVVYEGKTYTVTAIGDYAFHGTSTTYSNVSSVSIPKTVTSIGNHAFRYNSTMTEIDIPETVTSIGTYAFNTCSELLSITIPDGVETLSDRMFGSCSNLQTINFGENSALTTIGSYVCQNCTSLTEFTIPYGVNSIATSVWEGCRSLMKIHVLNPEPVSFTSSSYLTGIASYRSYDSPCVIYVPFGSEEAYEESGWYTYGVGYSSWKGKMIFNSSLVTIDAIDASGEEDYASYYHPYALTIPEGVKAYAITSFDSDGTLTMTEVTGVIPEHSAVLLERDASTGISSYRIYIAEDDETAAISGNLLYGSEEDNTTTNVNGVTEGYYFYGLTTKNGENLGFYWGAEDGSAFTIPANKAWLALPSAEAANISYLKLKKDGDTTGIESIEAAEATNNGAIYTLQGVRVSDMSQKGIYIVNGKKVLVK